MKSKEDSKIAVFEAGGSVNSIEIDKDEVEVLEPKILLYNHQNLLTTDYEKLKQDDHTQNRAEVKLIFRIKKSSELFYEPSPKKLINFYFVKHNNDSELKEVERKAEINFLFKEIITSSKEINISGISNNEGIKGILRNDSGILELKLIDKSGAKNPIIIKDSNITLDFRYFLVDEYKLSDVYAPSWPSPKKDEKFWTTKKIIAAVVIVIIVSLITYFREKIWRWWKGETKQEKKVREQLDIF